MLQLASVSTFQEQCRRRHLTVGLRGACYAAAGKGVGVGVGVLFRPGDSGVGVGVAVGVGVGVGLGMILVGPFGVGVGVALGVGAKSGVGETDGAGDGEELGEADGVGVGEALCAKARRGGTRKPATIKSSKLATAATAKISGTLACRNRITQRDAGPSGVVGHLDLRCLSSNVTIEP